MDGVLWLFDQAADGDHIAANRLHSGLSTLFSHPRCRLPARDVRDRLARLERLLEGL